MHDVAAARDRYVSLLGGNLLYEGDVALTQTRSAFVAVGDLVIELAQPQSGSSAIAKELADLIKMGLSTLVRTFLAISRELLALGKPSAISGVQRKAEKSPRQRGLSTLVRTF